MAPGRRAAAGARYDADAPLQSVRTKQTSLAWPHPVDERLEALVEAAISAGERTDRREVLAALVATTDVSGGQLARRIKKYRAMDVRAVLPAGAADGDGHVDLPHRPPGRRPGRSAPNG